jgi:DNA-packaging protein gp3
MGSKEGPQLIEVPKMRAMSIGGLCIFLDIARPTWGEYRKKDDFSVVCTRVEETIRAQKFEGASAELLNPSIIARDLGLAERQEHTGAEGGPIKTEATYAFKSLKPLGDAV